MRKTTKIRPKGSEIEIILISNILALVIGLNFDPFGINFEFSYMGEGAREYGNNIIYIIEFF